MIMGLDIGGANTKAASSDSSLAESFYLPLWRGAPLGMALQRLSEMDPDALGVVITGELADCFRSKAEGIAFIKTEVEKEFRCPIYFWGTSGFDWRDPTELAGANWSASSHLVAKDIGDSILVDMGSTTTDLIPIKGGPLAKATDFLRLAHGELVYSGLLRTSIGSLLRTAIIGDLKVPLSPEFFAITADAYLALDEISPWEYTCDTPDGSGKDRTSALRRLSRTVCADLEEIGEDGAINIAQQAAALQLTRIQNALKRLSARHSLNIVAAAGIGERVIAKASFRLGLSCIQLSKRYGKCISDIFPAYAVAKLLEDSLQMEKP